ncbi:hypothetical protein [Deinococcus aestuarii]|uniref:hypothetical protein n=1 Tax=Deinococcus aestuarii TaxID=2774531 RepID=UPI001C0CCE44|nr:hypothetical protein [Deinococcus aestuarii]
MTPNDAATITFVRHALSNGLETVIAHYDPQAPALTELADNIEFVFGRKLEFYLGQPGGPRSGVFATAWREHLYPDVPLPEQPNELRVLPTDADFRAYIEGAMSAQLAYQAQQQAGERARREAEVEAQRVALLERLRGRVVEVVTSRDHGLPIKVPNGELTVQEARLAWGDPRFHWNDTEQDDMGIPLDYLDWPRTSIADHPYPDDDDRL